MDGYTHFYAHMTVVRVIVSMYECGLICLYSYRLHASILAVCSRCIVKSIDFSLVQVLIRTIFSSGHLDNWPHSRLFDF